MSENQSKAGSGTIARYREFTDEEKARIQEYYNEKRLHDEASALGTARREGRAEGREEERASIIDNMRKAGFSEAQIKLALGE